MTKTKVYFSKVPKAKLPTRLGDFTIYGFKDPLTDSEIVALTTGKIGPCSEPVVSLHAQCLPGDTLASVLCDCGAQLHTAMRQILESNGGIVIYQQQEAGRRVPLIDKLRSGDRQANDLETPDVHTRTHGAIAERDYVLCAEILKYFHVHEIHLLSGSAYKHTALEKFGIKVLTQTPIGAPRPSATEPVQAAKGERTRRPAKHRKDGRRS